jgi:ribosomal protein S18 acetylase RimI-like enzyme
MSGKTAKLAPAPAVRYRPVREADVDALVELENACFDTDRLTRRNFLWMIRKAHAWFEVAEVDGVLAAYSLVLFHRGTSLARLYSIAVSSKHRGLGIARSLLARAESEAVEHDCVYMRLEVHPDNASAIAMYEQAGYYRFGLFRKYYDDQSDALRYEKRILYPQAAQISLQTPFYSQTTPFTCGPACLMMSMKALRPSLRLDRSLELQLWRESTTIFMMAGHGGCGPHGLALAADRRDFAAEIYLSHKGPLFVEGVRSADKKTVMELVHADFLRQTRKAGIPLRHRAATLDEIGEAIDRGGIPITLVSTYRFENKKVPHWVVIVGMDERFVYINDPDTDPKHLRTPTDNTNLPVARKQFERMSSFGARRLRATLIIYRRR